MGTKAGYYQGGDTHTSAAQLHKQEQNELKSCAIVSWEYVWLPHTSNLLPPAARSTEKVAIRLHQLCRAQQVPAFAGVFYDPCPVAASTQAFDIKRTILFNR